MQKKHRFIARSCSVGRGVVLNHVNRDIRDDTEIEHIHDKGRGRDIAHDAG